MKLLHNKTVPVRSVSVSCALIPLLAQFILHSSRPLALTISLSLFVACSILLFCPARDEPVLLSVIFTFLASVAVIAVCMGVKPTVIAVYVMGCDCAFLALRCRERYKEPLTFFRKDVVTHTMRFESRTAYMIAVIASGSMAVMAESSFMRWTMAVALLLTYALLVAREITGHSFFVRPSREKSIRELEYDNYKNRCSLDRNTMEDIARKGLYERIRKLMEDKRPYLDESYETEDLSRQVGTNRTYLAQTLSMFSGWNFCKFINKYRVDYAVDLIKKDKNMRISEVSTFSGFHSQTTFNSAFKFFMGVTPSEYKRHLWSKWRKYPSSLQEPGRQDPSESSSRDE